MRSIHKKTILLLASITIVFLLAMFSAYGKYRFPLMEQVATIVLVPVEYATSKLSFGVIHVGNFSMDILSVYNDNKQLKVENDQLRQNNLDVAEIMAENARLRAMLNYKNSAPQFDFVAAKVIARDPGTWTNTIVIDRGTADGVNKDMAVITSQGLAGSVVSAYSNVAKVQLLLDPRSAVGALVQRPESRVAAIVEGYGANPLTPRMVNIARDADIIKGDKIITSGFGGIYPKGLLIGEVLDVVNAEGGLLKYAVLKPSVDFDRLEEVLVIVNSRQQIAVPVQDNDKAQGAAK